MNFDKEKYAAILPVQCGKKRGTAFFVSPSQLLTAWHVVSEGVRNKVPVYCFYNDITLACNIVEFDEDSDVVLLTTQNYAHPVWISLLALPYEVEKPMAVAGYPMEIGLGRDLFDFPIHHAQRVTGREYDVVASPKEIIPFHSYKGFSGSPIVTDDGFAVGLVTDQMFSVIGYTTVRMMEAKLNAKGVPVVTDWESYDTSAYGYARSRELVGKQTQAAGDRYSPDLHVDSDQLNKEFRIFCRKTEQDRLDFNSVSKQIESWYLTIRKKYSFIDAQYTKGKYSFLRQALPDLRDKIASNDPSLQDYKAITLQEKNELYDWIALLNEITHTFQDTYNRCAFIRGAAGTGKTHFLCHLAQVHGVEYQAYLLFGSQFKMGEHIEYQIEQLLDFPKGLKGLNDYMADKNRYAIIIVDALNEGAGFAYWNGEVNNIPDLANKYPYVRFVLSSRNPIPKDFIIEEDKWMMRSTNGSIDLEKLRDSYFDKYGVDSRSVSQNIYEFSNPLFLRIFCVSYKRIPASKRGNISKPDLFGLYLNERNKQVVELVNVDPYKNVTADFFWKLANYSLYHCYCDDVSRDKARMYSNQVCRGRLWNQSLLYACLQENLLRESFDDKGVPCVEFEYQNLGDFLRAFTLLKSKNMDADHINEWLHDQRRKVIAKHMQRDKFTHFVGALLSVGNEKTETFISKALRGKEWDAELIDALQYRGPYNKFILSKFLNDGNVKIVNYLIRDVDEYDFYLIEFMHQTLMEMPLPVRDKNWSVIINELYDWNGLEVFQGKLSIMGMVKDDKKKLAVLLLWLLCSSYPALRATIVRKLVDLFTDTPEVVTFVCEFFKGCNDPYVMEGLYCAVYGMALRVRNTDVLSELGKAVYDLNYAKPDRVPNDLMVRLWTMKIMERVSALVTDFRYWHNVLPPFDTGENPFELLSEAVNLDKYYFGTSNGSYLLYLSLLQSDFNRYVIGTNSKLTDRLLVTKNNKEVLLSDITAMIGVQIKALGWSDELGDLDNGKYSSSRFDNEKERIGKKYQWIAYYDIMGRLTDCCYLRKGYYGEKHKLVHKVNYPWYADVKNYFDPALQAVSKEMAGVSFEDEKERKKLDQEPMEWYDDDTKLLPPQLVFTDLNGEEWLFICGSNEENQNTKKMSRSRSFFVNSGFVKKEDLDGIGDWAKNQNFFGRWMPEHFDNINFRWNEYPWADSYKQSLDFEQWELPSSGECPSKIMVSYMGQLQEDVRGFNADKDFRASVFMPCEDIMIRLKLHNAERGIIRKDANDEVIGVDYGITGVGRRGMLLKKSELDMYLQETGYTLFWFISADKTQRTNEAFMMKELSACWKYNLEERFVELQEMRVAKKYHS